MHIELQQTMQHLLQVPEWDMEAMVKEVSRFTPVDFRMGIQWLVAQDKPDLAQALAEAGLSLFPDSEDILAISGLLSMSRQDWCLAVELLQDLIAVQKERVQPMTFQMLARALACNLDISEAHQVLDKALQYWPNDGTLLEEKMAMSASLDAMSAPAHTN